MKKPNNHQGFKLTKIFILQIILCKNYILLFQLKKNYIYYGVLAFSLVYYSISQMLLTIQAPKAQFSILFPKPKHIITSSMTFPDQFFVLESDLPRYLNRDDCIQLFTI